MKTKSKALNLSAKLVALAFIMVCSNLLVSCYEKSELDLDTTQPAAIYYIAGVVTDYNYGGVLKGVTVKVGDQTATTGNYGEFSIRLGDITPAAEGYAVTYSLDGYDTATNVVYITAVAEGLSSITTANVALRVSGTATENPAAPPVEGADTSVDKAEIEAVSAEIEELIALTEEAKEEMANEIAALLGASTVGEITVGEIETTIEEDGSVLASTPVSFENPVIVPTMTYPYTITSGFEVVGDIESVAKPVTRAVITDGTAIANFKKSVASELNMSEGFKAVAETVTLSVPTGYGVMGYKIIKKFVTKRHTYLINGEYLSGMATTEESTKIEPQYDSHNSHDAHGSNPNAGGGASN